ncbi:MAG: threonine ammonia-lyase [Pseudomonadota bacterium]
MTDLPVTFDDVQRAAAEIGDHVVRTPTVPASALTDLAPAALYLKLENLQPTASFKVRGACNRLAALTNDERKRGVIALSAGNHAQGVAYHARRLSVPATIVMPRFTPFNKVAKTEAMGAEVVLIGDNLDDARGYVAERVANDGLVLVHPFDDPLIVAGQGTVALEMLADVPDLDVLVVPIGGGGLIGGIAIAAKALKPDITIIGAEAALYPSMGDALAGREAHYEGATIADGIAVKRPGDLNRQIASALVDDVLQVEEVDFERAVNRLLADQKLMVEGAGAAGVAAIMTRPGLFESARVGTVLCGGNIDPRVLSSVLMRGLARKGQMVRLRIGILDAPGALGRITGVIGESGGNIIDVYHLRLLSDLPIKRAEIDVIVETRDLPHVQRIVDALNNAGFEARLQTSVSG